MSFSELLKQCRKQQGMSQAELASKLGVTQQAVGKWESGKSSPDPTTVARIAEILSTTADFLLGLYRPVASSNTPEERFFGNYAESLIPVIGTVKAGYGALAFEEDYGQEYARVKDPSNYFYLVVRGDSMEPRIQDGDLALVHKQDTLENGDLGVLVYGDEGEVAVLNARLHAVAPDDEVEIVGGVLDAGILLPVILLKGQRAVPGLHGADDRDEALGVVAEKALLGGGCVGHRAVKPQQEVCRGAQDLGNAGHRGGVGGGFAAFPLADGLLGHSQFGCQLRLTDPLLLAALLQKL